MKHYFSRLIPENRLARSVLGIASGTAAGQAIIISVSPVLTRIYTPDNFGIFSLYVAVIAIIGVVASLRYEFAIPIADDDREVSIILVIACLFTFIIASISYGVLYLAWEPIQHILNLRVLESYRWLIPCGIITIGLFNIFNYLGIKDKDYKTLAYSKLSQGIGVAGVQVFAGLMFLGGLGLILGDVLGRLLGTLHIAINILKKYIREIKHVNLQSLAGTISKYRRFPFFSASAALFNTLGLRLPVILIAALYGAEAAGWLMLSQMVIGSPMTLIGQSVSRVYSGELGNHIRTGPEKIRPLFLNVTRKLARYCFVPVLFLAILSPIIFEFVFGAAWKNAGVYTQILSLMLMAQIIVNPVSTTLTLLEKQEIQMFWDIGRVILICGTFFVSSSMGLDDTMAVTTYSLVMVVLYIALWFISYHQVKTI